MHLSVPQREAVREIQTARIITRLRWYMDTVEARDVERIEAGGPLAIVGGTWDDVTGFADRLDAARPVLDLRRWLPPKRAVVEMYEMHPDTIAIADRPERVMAAIGLIVQPWYLSVRPLAARPEQALTLLRQAIEQLGVSRPIEELGDALVEGLASYSWPRGLVEIRATSERLAALLSGGSFTAGARRLAVSRQALQKFVARRFA
jgi:hypothetical protein